MSQGDAMRTLKMQEFLKEFPWLERHIKEMEGRTGIEITHTAVKRVDENLLRQNPIKFISYYYLLLDSEGNKICEVGTSLPPQKRWFGKGPKVDEGERILDTLAKLEPQAQKCVHYVLAFESSALCINKPPKTFTLVGWVAEQRRRASEEVKKELTAIDTEAEE